MAVLLKRILLVAMIVAFPETHAQMDATWYQGKTGFAESSNQVTEAFVDKFREIFDLLDNDNDGTISLGECYKRVLELIDYFHPSDKLLPDIVELYLFYNDIIETYFGRNTTKTSLTEPDYIMAVFSFRANHFDLFNQRLHTLYTGLFHVMDTDKDGVASFEEFYYYYKSFGGKGPLKEISRKAFNAIDADGNGVIDEDEFRDTYLNYLWYDDTSAEDMPLFVSPV